MQAPTAWLNGWDERVGIVIDRNDVDAALVNFPILVYLSNSSSGRNNDDVSFRICLSQVIHNALVLGISEEREYVMELLNELQEEVLNS